MDIIRTESETKKQTRNYIEISNINRDGTKYKKIYAGSIAVFLSGIQ